MNQLMEGQGFPSKVYSIMACKKPLLVISGKNSPLNNFLKDEDAAYLISSTDLNDKCKQLEAKIRAIIDNKQVLLLKGEIGYKRIVNEYSKRFVVKKYVQLVEEITRYV
jgi:spore maturation protein CgeB